MDINMENKEFICWYAYQGHETEGNVFLHEPQIYKASCVAEAMYRYLIWCGEKGHTGYDPRKEYKTWKDYEKNDPHITGWGWWCRELTPAKN